LPTNKQKYLKKLGAHIKQLREKKKLTQFDLACNINKDRQSIQRLESGNVNPTIYYLQEIADGLNISLKSLITITKH
jgi:putative transcriptional regulator